MAAAAVPVSEPVRPRFIVVSSPAGSSCVIDAEKAVALSDRMSKMVAGGQFSLVVPDFSAAVGAVVVQYVAGDLSLDKAADVLSKMTPVEIGSCVSMTLALGFDSLATRVVPYLLPTFQGAA